MRPTPDEQTWGPRAALRPPEGATQASVHYDPRCYAGNVLDPDGYSLELVYES